jgi:predicted TIM-barrel fold metal-dependent hydrolase
MAKYFDVHNHLFNKNFLAKELLYRLMKELKKFLDQQDDEEREIRDSVRGLKKVISAFKRFSYTIKVFTRKDSIAIYEELNKTYKGEFILTPLTFDLTYCFAPSADRAIGAPPEPSVKDVFEREMNTMFEMIEDKARPLSRDFNTTASPEEDELWNEYLDEKSRFLANATSLEEQHQQNTDRQVHERGIADILPDSFDGFEEQLRQIIELRNHPEYRNNVFPFLAVDPRRTGIAEYAKENVGKGKLFIGVKLYCPNGYSPTDPLLYGPEGEKGGIYAFCEENGIPVTAHNSDAGFATFSKSVKISGHIHFQGNLHRLDNELLTFNTSIFQKHAIQERALTLNHPLIWEKVVEKYPNLILNLAHFGGGQQLDAALDDPANINLWSNRIISLLKDPRYKVYTDISCFYDFDVIRKFIASPVYKEIRSKTLYGSDYILLLLFENNFEDNVAQFMQLFGSDFEIIAGSNPREFLKHVLD